MAQTNPRAHARRTRILRRRELTRKLVAAASQPKPEQATADKTS